MLCAAWQGGVCVAMILKRKQKKKKSSMNREASVYGSNTNYLINHVTPTEFYFTHVITDPSRQFGSAHYYAN